MSDDEILDLNGKGSNSGGYDVYFYIFSVLTALYWYAASIQHWPFSGQALLLSLCSLLIITTIRFMRKDRRPLHEYAYFLGKIVLMAAVFFTFQNLAYGNLLIAIAFLFFAAGLVSVFLNRKE